MIAIIFFCIPPFYAFLAGSLLNTETQHTHKYLEDTLSQVDSDFFTPEAIKHIYFGNWLRDYSQLNDPSLRKYLSEDNIIKIVNMAARKEFGTSSDFHVNKDNLGVYRPEQHIDNPVNLENESARDDRFYPGAKQDLLRVNQETAQKGYIINFTRNYFSESIRKSVEAYSNGRIKDAFRFFGSSLHCFEDFYSHTNFIELALIDLGYDSVYPYVGKNTAVNCGNYNCFPLVTGYYNLGQSALDKNRLSRLDAQLSRQIQLLKRSKSFWRRSRLSSIEMKQNMQDESELNAIRTRVRRALAPLSMLDSFAQRTSIQDLLSRIDPDKNTDPSHYELNKDKGSKEAHEIAIQCTVIALRSVAEAMVEAWTGQLNADSVVSVMMSFIQHPAHLDNRQIHFTIKRWARRNKGRIDEMSATKR